MLTALRSRAVRLLWLGQSASALGDALLAGAVGEAVGGSTLMVAGGLAIHRAPARVHAVTGPCVVRAGDRDGGHRWCALCPGVAAVMASGELSGAALVAVGLVGGVLAPVGLPGGPDRPLRRRPRHWGVRRTVEGWLRSSATRTGALLLVVFLGIGVTLPVLPGAVRDAGAGTVALGVVLGVFPLAALLGRVVAGRSADRRGRVVTVRAGVLCSAVSGLLLALSLELPLPVAGLVAARLLHGLGDALVYTAAAAYVLDRTDDTRRPQALALLGSAIWTGYALGPLVGAALGVRGAGLVVLACAAVALALTAGLPDTPPAAPGPAGLRGLLPAGVALPGVALGLGNLGYAAVVGFLVLHLDERGARGALALTAFSVAVLLGRLLVVPLAARIGILRTVPYGLVVMATGLLVLGATRSTAVAAVAAALVGLGYCLPFPALGALVADRVGPAQRGAAIGALTAFYDVFVGVGSLVFGLVAQGRGTQAVFVLAAAGVLLAAAVNVLLGHEQRRAQQAERAVPAR